jgi:hypothetical protein
MQVSDDPGGAWSAAPELPYRGARTYINGADLYAASTDLVSSAVGAEAITGMDVRYPRFTRCRGTFYLTERPVNETKWASSPVRIQASTTDGRRLTGWYEETTQPARNRLDNHEKAVVAGTVISDSSARYTGDAGPPGIEILVYVTKTLLVQLLPDGRGKWIFTALRSNGLLPDHPQDVKIILDSAVGSRAAACSVMIAGSKFGDIYFGRAEE